MPRSLGNHSAEVVGKRALCVLDSAAGRSSLEYLPQPQSDHTHTHTHTHTRARAWAVDELFWSKMSIVDELHSRQLLVLIRWLSNSELQVDRLCALR
jgi:hypothetical protein